MDEKKPPADYLKGYNQGYLLAKHVPEFSLSSIKPPANSNTPSQRMLGFMDGAKQHSIEKFKSRTQKHIPPTSKDKTPPKGPNIDR